MSDMKCPFCGEKIEHIKDGWCNCKNRCTGSGSIELWLQFLRTCKTLEQSETCCTEWEKQALDYKAENIALSGELERTRKTLEIAVDALKSAKKRLELINNSKFANLNNVLQIQSQCEILKIEKALEQITAQEQKESAFVHNKIEFPEYNDGLLEEFDKQFFENGQDDDLTETALEQKDAK